MAFKKEFSLNFSLFVIPFLDQIDAFRKKVYSYLGSNINWHSNTLAEQNFSLKINHHYIKYKNLLSI